MQSWSFFSPHTRFRARFSSTPSLLTIQIQSQTKQTRKKHNSWLQSFLMNRLLCSRSISSWTTNFFWRKKNPTTLKKQFFDSEKTNKFNYQLAMPAIMTDVYDVKNYWLIFLFLRSIFYFNLHQRHLKNRLLDDTTYNSLECDFKELRWWKFTVNKIYDTQQNGWRCNNED